MRPDASSRSKVSIKKIIFSSPDLTYLLPLLPDPRGPMPDSPTHYSFLPDSIGIAISREGARIYLRQ